jgi:hypothetical protein
MGILSMLAIFSIALETGDEMSLDAARMSAYAT